MESYYSIRYHFTIKDAIVLVLDIPTSNNFAQDRSLDLAEVFIGNVDESSSLKGSILDKIEIEDKALPFEGLTCICSSSFSMNCGLGECMGNR